MNNTVKEISDNEYEEYRVKMIGKLKLQKKIIEDQIKSWKGKINE